MAAIRQGLTLRDFVLTIFQRDPKISTKDLMDELNAEGIPFNADTAKELAELLALQYRSIFPGNSIAPIHTK